LQSLRKEMQLASKRTPVVLAQRESKALVRFRLPATVVLTQLLLNQLDADATLQQPTCMASRVIQKHTSTRFGQRAFSVGGHPVPLFAEQKLDYDSCPDLTTLAELAQTEDTYDPTLVDWRSVKVGAHCHVTLLH
jgi:hypothetical protein